MAFSKREACLFRDKPRLLCRSSSSLSLIHKPDGSSSSSSAFSFCLFFALWFEFSSFFSFYASLLQFRNLCFSPPYSSPPLLSSPIGFFATCLICLLISSSSVFYLKFLSTLLLLSYPRSNTAVYYKTQANSKLGSIEATNRIEKKSFPANCYLSNKLNFMWEKADIWPS